MPFIALAFDVRARGKNELAPWKCHRCSITPRAGTSCRMPRLLLLAPSLGAVHSINRAGTGRRDAHPRHPHGRPPCRCTMKMTKPVLLLLLLTAVPSALADITITPAAPTTVTAISIRVGVTLEREAWVQSSSIRRTGEYSFSIQQTIAMRCGVPPVAPRFVGSEFNVGPLAPGTYAVTASTLLVDGGAFGSCGTPPPINETSVFQVVRAEIPLLDTTGVLLLVVSIAVGGVTMLRLGG